MHHIRPHERGHIRQHHYHHHHHHQQQHHCQHYHITIITEESHLNESILSLALLGILYRLIISNFKAKG